MRSLFRILIFLLFAFTFFLTYCKEEPIIKTENELHQTYYMDSEYRHD